MYGDDFNSFEPINFFELSKELYMKMNGLDSNESSSREPLSADYIMLHFYMLGNG